MNICEWTRKTVNWEAGILQALYCDVISISETHLTERYEIFVSGYTWFGFNRYDIHKRAPKASGGVGIMVKRWNLENFNVHCIYNGQIAWRNSGCNVFLSF